MYPLENKDPALSGKGGNGRLLLASTSSKWLDLGGKVKKAREEESR